MRGGGKGHLWASLIAGLLLVVAATVVSSCADVIGLGGIDRVDCVLDCGPTTFPEAGLRDGGTHSDAKPGEDAKHLGKDGSTGNKDGGGNADTGQPPCASDDQCTSATAPRCDTASGNCVACLPANDNCPTGQYCQPTGSSFACVVGCATRANCNGDAGADGGALSCCDAACVNTATNASTCGGCGQACSPDNIETLSCAGGACTGTCATGYADCNGNKLTDGCETNIAGTDVSNCGGCDEQHRDRQLCGGRL